MHFGTGPISADALTDIDPYILDVHLSEIGICSQVSKSIFFIVSTCTTQLMIHFFWFYRIKLLYDDNNN